MQKEIARSRAAAVLSVVLSLLSSGCGSDRPQTYPVSGRVRFSDGDPVRLGTVELLSLEHGINATGTIQQDGTFRLGTFDSEDGACAGEHQAIVMQMLISEGLIKHEVDHGAPVDVQFASYASSPLRVTVKPEEGNQIELVVEKAKKR